MLNLQGNPTLQQGEALALSRPQVFHLARNNPLYPLYLPSHSLLYLSNHHLRPPPCLGRFQGLMATRAVQMWLCRLVLNPTQLRPSLCLLPHLHPAFPRLQACRYRDHLVVHSVRPRFTHLPQLQLAEAQDHLQRQTPSLFCSPNQPSVQCPRHFLSPALCQCIDLLQVQLPRWVL